jgi:hypothetical protein
MGVRDRHFAIDSSHPRILMAVALGAGAGGVGVQASKSVR